MHKRQEAAKQIANEVMKRRRDAQYAAMLNWKSGKMTGLQCIEEIERLATLILLKPEDFRPPKENKPEIKDKK